MFQRNTDTKVCLLVSDNVFSQIFCNCLNLDDCDRGTIEHLVCCTMCSKKNENRLTNEKKNLIKNSFE